MAFGYTAVERGVNEMCRTKSFHESLLVTRACWMSHLNIFSMNLERDFCGKELSYLWDLKQQRVIYLMYTLDSRTYEGSTDNIGS